MRSVKLLSVLSVVVLGTSIVACAPGSEDDNANDQTQDVTGGSGAVESPVVYLFEGADKTLQPKCAGAMLSDTIAVTVKSCAKEGMVLGRATDEDGKGERAQVKALHVPTTADADIAVVELDRPLKGTHAVITHIPLRDGYAVNGVAAADERGIFSPLSPNKGEASSIKGKLISETDTHASITPEKGSTICAGDIGAPVCSSTGLKILNWNITGTCGLSGLVVGPADATPASTTPPANGPKVANGGETATAPGATNTSTCNGGAWKVVELGQHADFLRQFAPEAFKPVVIDKPIIRNFPSVPEGLWGWKTKGDIQSCKIETAKLDPVAANTASKVTAKVFFKNMEEKATAFGRFGIAPKSAPKQMRWLPAKSTTAQSGNNFELTFEGAVTADKDGEYIVGFRASANGGESWSLCGIEGIEKNGAVEKGLSLKVGNAPSTPTTPEGPGTSTPKDTPQTPGSPDYSDPPATSSSNDSDLPSSSSEGDPTGEDEVTPAKKKKTDSGGCSAAPSSSSTTAGLPMIGLLLGVAAFLRRRR